jgi:hypothetical protein
LIARAKRCGAACFGAVGESNFRTAAHRADTAREVDETILQKIALVGQIALFFTGSSL